MTRIVTLFAVPAMAAARSPSAGPRTTPVGRRTPAHARFTNGNVTRRLAVLCVTVRSTAAIAAAASIVLLAAACGGSPSSGGSARSSNAGGSTNTDKALAFTQCMRTRGVPNFPDPNSSGSFNKDTLQHLASTNSQYQAAQKDCQHLLPMTSSGVSTEAEVARAMSAMVRFTGCMRGHGVPDWPDPDIGPHGRPVFDLPSIDPNSPQVSTAVHECRHLMPQDTSPYVCSRALAEQIGGPPDALACEGGSPTVP